MLNRSPSRSRLCSVVLTGLLALVVFTGCSSDSDPESGVATTTSEPAASPSGSGESEAEAGSDGCPAEGDVSAAIGAAVALDPSSNAAEGCNYYGEDAGATSEVSVNVLVEQPTSQTLEDVERNLEVTRVEGVGDGAWEMVTPGGIVQFGAFDGDRYVTVTISGASDDPAMGRTVYELLGAP